MEVTRSLFNQSASFDDPFIYKGTSQFMQLICCKCAHDLEQLVTECVSVAQCPKRIKSTVIHICETMAYYLQKGSICCIGCVSRVSSHSLIATHIPVVINVPVLLSHNHFLMPPQWKVVHLHVNNACQQRQ